METSVTNPAIVFLLGKPPRPDTIFPRVFECLVGHGFEPQVELPHVSGLAAADWPKGALIVHRGLDAVWVERLAEIERAGWAVCNGAAASIAAQDRPTVMARLAGAKLPVPQGQVVQTWTEVLRLGGRGGLVIKAADGRRGRSAGVHIAPDGILPEQAPFPGPYHIEAFVANDGVDRKLYVAGATCRCLLKPWPRSSQAEVRAVDARPEFERLARRAGEALGLDLFGVDIVIGPQGLAIVDVNLFPSYKCVPDGAEMVADQIALRACGIMGERPTAISPSRAGRRRV
jgi:ribosomal protein S6--L-glutamate ligase